MEFTIERAKWLRGEGSGASYLLRKSDGKMCCLGFYLAACGVPNETLTGVDSSGSLENDKPSTVPADAHWLLHLDQSKLDGLNSSDARNLFFVNDRKDMDAERREEAIAVTFAKHGVTVKFL